MFPTFAQDFLEAAVLAKAVHEKDIEPLRPLANPLDVLAQTLVSCAATEEWETGKLYDVPHPGAAPYATLPRSAEREAHRHRSSLAQLPGYCNRRPMDCSQVQYPHKAMGMYTAYSST